MSQPISVEKQQVIGYSEFGQTTKTEEIYVKLSVRFKDLMHSLKGARLSAFFELALNEAEISFGHSRGLTLYQIADDTGYGTRATLYALEYLCQKRYATKLDERGPQGESLYRVCAFAWFGSPRDVPPETARPGYAKNAHPPVQKQVLDRRSESNSDSEDSTSSRSGVHLLRTLNLRVDHLNLSEMTLARAERIAEWVRSNPEKKTRPAGFAYACLRNNPLWDPPVAKPPNSFINAEFAIFTHGAAEHMDYLRAHPEERAGCDCWQYQGDDAVERCP